MAALRSELQAAVAQVQQDLEGQVTAAAAAAVAANVKTQSSSAQVRLCGVHLLMPYAIWLCCLTLTLTLRPRQRRRRQMRLPWPHHYRSAKANRGFEHAQVCTGRYR